MRICKWSEPLRFSFTIPNVNNRSDLSQEAANEIERKKAACSTMNFVALKNEHFARCSPAISSWIFETRAAAETLHLWIVINYASKFGCNCCLKYLFDCFSATCCRTKCRARPYAQLRQLFGWLFAHMMPWATCRTSEPLEEGATDCARRIDWMHTFNIFVSLLLSHFQRAASERSVRPTTQRLPKRRNHSNRNYVRTKTPASGFV